MNVERAITEALGARPVSLERLSGGCIGDVYRAHLSDGNCVVVKADFSSGAKLDIEAYMLRTLAERSELPVPRVLYGSPSLLVMEFVEGDSSLDKRAQRHAAELLAALHAIRGDAFGFNRDTLIGGLHQPNPPTEKWVPFFREHRLLYMAEEAAREHSVTRSFVARLERFCGRLEDWLLEPPHPSLLHGDMWTTNILAKNGKITAFLDPATYYGHPEIELAFSTLFGTFGDPFFARYNELRPIPAGFFETRRDIYNLYPLLVHVRLFGSSYLAGVERVLSLHGY